MPNEPATQLKPAAKPTAVANPGAGLGRYSLEAKSVQEAMESLKQLDAAKAVDLGRADRSVLDEHHVSAVSLEAGKEKYLAYDRRPSVMGGAGASTAKRYRAVFDKFIEFARNNGVTTWEQVGKNLLLAYGAWLDDAEYAYASEYLELTTIR